MSDDPLKFTIQAQNSAFMVAAQEGDAAALAALYTEDAWLLPPGGETIQGREKIEAFWSSRLDRIAEVKLAIIDVVPLGDDAAREVGRSVILTKSLLAEEITGKYLVVWKQVDGVWKIEANIWNSNT
jgi:uncharacterized protein (TIGR02246 family)